jgi:apolipoprotein D and lipocalin family protein
MTLLSTLISPVNEPVTKVDIDRYAGSWYVIGFIPTSFDKNWNYTIEQYTKNKKGGYDVFTAFRVDDEQKSVKSKAFIDKALPSKWKVQYVWPFRADYWIIELADDYSYTVVGHPKHKFLYIMSRKPKMDETLYKAIVERCKLKGYATEKIRKQLQTDS